MADQKPHAGALCSLPARGGRRQLPEEEDELGGPWRGPSTCGAAQAHPRARFRATAPRRPAYQRAVGHQYNRQVRTHPLPLVLRRFQPGLLDRLSHQGHHGTLQVLVPAISSAGFSA